MNISNFQSWANEQGAAFNDECIRALSYAGFEIADTEVYLRDVGITLDAVTNNQRGVAMAWEFKGSWQGTRPGLIRTDTTKKAIANGTLMQWSEFGEFTPPMLIMTSHIPDSGDSALMLQMALRKGILLDVVDSRDSKKLKRLAQATDSEIQAILSSREV